MAFKLASIILILFALIGVVVMFTFDFNSHFAVFFCLLCYVCIPMYGAYGCWNKRRLAISVALVFFLSQMVREMGYEIALPHISPITILYSMENLTDAKGVYIDLFALGMVLLLSWLLYLIAVHNRQNNNAW